MLRTVQQQCRNLHYCSRRDRSPLSYIYCLYRSVSCIINISLLYYLKFSLLYYQPVLSPLLSASSLSSTISQFSLLYYQPVLSPLLTMQPVLSSLLTMQPVLSSLLTMQPVLSPLLSASSLSSTDYATSSLSS